MTGVTVNHLHEFPRKFNDLEYVKLDKPQRKKRKLDMLSAPYPELDSSFSVHTPPSTPRRTNTRRNPTTPSTPLRLQFSTIKLSDLKSLKFGTQPIVEDCSTDQPTTTPLILPEEVCLSHPDVFYEEENQAEVPEITHPNQSEIMNTCENFLPVAPHPKCTLHIAGDALLNCLLHQPRSILSM